MRYGTVLAAYPTSRDSPFGPHHTRSRRVAIEIARLLRLRVPVVLSIFSVICSKRSSLKCYIQFRNEWKPRSLLSKNHRKKLRHRTGGSGFMKRADMKCLI